MDLIWTITDGKSGDRVQCLGVAERLAASLPGRIEERTVRPRAPFVWLMPWGPPDPRDHGSLAPPYPAVAIASGRRAAAYLRRLKALSPASFTVFLKDPRSGTRTADLIWVPEHDRLRGANVLTSLTSPHRLTPERLAQARRDTRPELLALPQPRVAVLLGGPSKDVAFADADIALLGARLAALAATGAGIMVTASRRTPDALAASVAAALAGRPAFIWDKQGTNPYEEMLGLADAIVVTADSVNMVGEAAATGRPVLVFEPGGLNPKHVRYLDGLRRHGAVAKFEGRLETFAYQPLDSTPLIAREILERLHRTSKS